MNSKDNRETNDQSVIIEDLNAHNVEEIKGGPSQSFYAFDGFIGGVTVSSAASAGGGGGAGKVQMQDFHFVVK